MQPLHDRPVGRRPVLAALAAAVALPLSGCGADVARLADVRWEDEEPPSPPPPGPDETAVRATVRDVETLHRGAVAAATTTGDGSVDAALAPLLASVADVHARQLDALGAGAPPASAPTTAPEDSAGPDEPVPTTAGLPTAEGVAAFAALSRTGQVSGGVARLLASVAAAEAVCARLLASALGRPAPAAPAPVTEATEQSWSRDVDGEAADALAAALAGEHAAVYGYGVLAARLTDDERDLAVQHLAEHEREVERLTELLRGAEAEAPAPEPAYDVPVHQAAPGALRELAASLEERTCARHADAVAATTGGARILAGELVLGAALRAAAWRGAPSALPGLDGRL